MILAVREVVDHQVVSVEGDSFKGPSILRYSCILVLLCFQFESESS